RNQMATLLLSQGTPMLLMGDEQGRTQHGNNNAYCQDNEITWMRWQDVGPREEAFHQFVTGLLRIRRSRPLPNQPQILHGAGFGGSSNCSGSASKEEAESHDDWCKGINRSGGLLPRARHGKPLLMFLNAYHEGVAFKLPQSPTGAWRLLVDTEHGKIEPRDAT